MAIKAPTYYLMICVVLGITLMMFACTPGKRQATSTTAFQPAVSPPSKNIAAPPPTSAASPALPSKPTATQPPDTPTPSPTPLAVQSIVLSGHSGPVTRLAWSPDGALLASASGSFDSKDFTIHVWNRDGGLENDLVGHTQPVTDLAWSPDGKTLASSSLDSTLRLWNRDGTLRQALNGNAGHVFAVAWSPDGQVLATGAIVTFTNPTVQLWNPAGKILQTVSTSFSGGKFYNLAWSPDGRFLLGGATDYKLWRADGEQVFWLQSCSHCTPAWAMTWAPGSQQWAIGDESSYVEIYTVTGQKIAQLQDSGGVNSLAWSPDGSLLAGLSTIWSPDGKYLYTLRDQSRYVNSNAWSPDGKILASGGSDMLVHLWAADGTPLAALQGHRAGVNVVAWSPDGAILASASDDKTVRLWKIK
jgi:WD40 repeat protein